MGLVEIDVGHEDRRSAWVIARPMFMGFCYETGFLLASLVLVMG